MAQRNLEGAVRAVLRHPERAAQLRVGEQEAAQWQVAAKGMRIPYDERLRVHPQSEDYTRHQRWDFEATSPDQYPLLLHFPYFDLYRKQVVKQADLVLAMELRGDAFSDEDKARNFRYYEGITVRDSSLSACSQSVVAAEVGYLRLAYEYWAEAALIDLNDLQHNTRDGLHMASLAGAWIAAVAGFGGLRDHGGVLRFKPRLPPQLNRLTFTVAIRGTRLRVSIAADRTTYALVDGQPIEIRHDDERIELRPGATVERPTLVVRDDDPPTQPKSRAPLYRGRGTE
jgi:alpha,alpha-trehalose phosphorylase